MPIAEFSNWLRRVIWDRILRGRSPRNETVKQCRRQMTVANSPVNCLFSVFSNINGKHENTLTTSKKYSWCIPVQKEIKPIIWGAAITPEPWNRQQRWFIFEDPNVRVARLLESLATIIRRNENLVTDGDYTVYAPSQWETTLHCNVVSYWLGAYTNWSLHWWYCIFPHWPHRKLFINYNNFRCNQRQQISS